MHTRLTKDITASSTQVLLNQVLGLFIFIITSRYLGKAVYGELNWSLAVLTFATTLLSLRLEQVVVKKIASGEDASTLLSVFSGHVFFSGFFFYFVLLAGRLLFPLFFTAHFLLLLLAVSQLLSFFSMPLKQLANGKEKFGWLAVMSSVSNVVKIIGLIALLWAGSFTIEHVVALYILSSLMELLVSIYLVQKRLEVRIRKWPVKEYVLLLRESIPQVGVVFLNACIARVDWILLGLFSTQVIMAEYSFAYKIVELSPVPLLIIGPVLLTRFSAWFANNQVASFAEKQQEINFLVRLEMIAATFLPLLLNVAWSPLIDGLTQNKYGKVNETVFFILSACIPFQYLINFFWTIHFAQGHLKMIFRIALVTCLVIVAGDLLLIPLLNAKGAALVYLAAMFAEYILYCFRSPFIATVDKWLPLVACLSSALVSGLSVRLMNLPVAAALALAATGYLVLLLLTGQVKKSDAVLIKQKLFHRPVNCETV